MDYIGATPQANPLLGLLAERLKQAQEFAAKPFGYSNPPAEMIMNLLGVPAVQQTAERLAYGEPLTTGRGMTTQIRPEAVEAALTVAPAVGLLGKGTEKAAMAAGRAGERYAEKVVPQIMERGGLPAQLLGDLAQGSRRKIFVPASQEEAFQASKLLRKNTPEEVWQETGVAKFGDDFVKEISDKEATAGFTHLYDVNGGSQLRERAYEHPELYSLVPELKDVKQLGLRENLLSGNYGKIGEGRMITAKAPTEEDLKTVLTHEMQHGVQDVYGWERGGSPKDIAIDIAENKLKAEEVKSKLERMQNVASDNARHANKDLIEEAKKWAEESNYWNKDADNQTIVKEYLLSNDPVYASLYQTHADLAYNKPALLGAEETYNRLAGEVQARSAQNRVNLTPEERRMYFPFEYKSEKNKYGLDVRPEDIIYRSLLD